MNDLEKFILENEPKGTFRLNAHKEDIWVLKRHGYSNKDVQRFLFEKKGIKVSITTLNRFIKQHKETQPIQREPTQPPMLIVPLVLVPRSRIMFISPKITIEWTKSPTKFVDKF